MPLLEVAPGRYIAESNAILWYIAGGTPLFPGGPHRTRRNAAMDVLRAAQPRAQHRRRLFLAGAGQGRTRIAAARARRLDAGGLSRARRDGEASRQAGSISPPSAIPSPTSRSTPTPIWRISATTTWRASRRCAAGSTASPPSQTTSPWTGSRPGDGGGAITTARP